MSNGSVKFHRLDPLTCQVDTAHVKFMTDDGKVVYDVTTYDRQRFPNRIATEKEFMERWFFPS